MTARHAGKVDFSLGPAPTAVQSSMNTTQTPSAHVTTPARAAALVEGCASSCNALRAMADVLYSYGCPVQDAIAAGLYALAAAQEDAELATR
jgi:hypothetical protein